jgi:hypothetical protein
VPSALVTLRRPTRDAPLVLVPRFFATMSYFVCITYRYFLKGPAVSGKNLFDPHSEDHSDFSKNCMRAFPWPNIWSRIQISSRNRHNPKIGQYRTILRQRSDSANQNYQGDSAVLTYPADAARLFAQIEWRVPRYP